MEKKSQRQREEERQRLEDDIAAGKPLTVRLKVPAELFASCKREHSDLSWRMSAGLPNLIVALIATIAEADDRQAAEHFRRLNFQFRPGNRTALESLPLTVRAAAALKCDATPAHAALDGQHQLVFDALDGGDERRRLSPEAVEQLANAAI